MSQSATVTETAQAVAAPELTEIPELNAQTLVEAGVHFGHSARNWDPRMKRFIFGKRNGVHVINIKETLRGAVKARHFLKQVASAGVDILIVGTKKQAAEAVRQEAQRASSSFVATRWLGGTLTNHSTIRQRLKRLEEIEALKNGPRWSRESKKEQARIDREHKKIAVNLEGLRRLDKLPAVLLVVDAKHEHNAVNEARKLNIPLVGIVDTDSNPDTVDILIPANDDSLRGIHIILRYLCDGIIEGRKLFEAGRGLKDAAASLQVTLADPHAEPGRRDRKGGKGGDRGRRQQRSRPSGGRSEVEVQAAEAEAVEQAQAQTGRAPAQVRVKPAKGKPPAAPQQGGDSAAPKTE